MLTRILIGLIISAVGFLFVWKTDIPLELIGPIQLGEKWFGSSRTFFKLLGVIFCLLGFSVITNVHQGVLESFAGLFYSGQ